MSLLEGILTVLDVSLGDELSRLHRISIEQAVNICDVLWAAATVRFLGVASRGFIRGFTVQERQSRRQDFQIAASSKVGAGGS